MTAAPTPPSTHPAQPVDLTVIVCVHNGGATVCKQLAALDRQQWERRWDVVVVDNRSTDNTPSVVRDFVATHPRFRTVTAPEKPGLSYAKNVGVASTTAPAVAFCDDDDVVADGWVAAMGSALLHHPVVACRFVWHVNGDSRDDADRGGIFQRDHIEQLYGYPVAAGVSGWQRWLWDALGGNDESMMDTGEDFDMSIRAHLAHGVIPHFEPDAVCHVTRRSGFRSTFRQARRYGKSSVTLYGRYGRNRIDRRTEMRRSLRSWAWLVRNVFDLRNPTHRALWARQAGIRFGRLEQSIRSRTLWL